MKQNQYKPISIEHMVIVIYSGVNGYLDKIPVNRVTALEAQMIPYVEANCPEIFDSVKKENKISDKVDALIKKTLTEFLKVFV